MLVKFSCGCIGFIAFGDAAYVVKPCDVASDDYNKYTCYSRDLSNKDFKYISREEETGTWKEIDKLITDGYKFRQLQSLLK